MAFFLVGLTQNFIYLFIFHKFKNMFSTLMFIGKLLSSIYLHLSLLIYFSTLLSGLKVATVLKTKKDCPRNTRMTRK